MPRTATLSEIMLTRQPDRRTATYSELTGAIPAAQEMGSFWADDDIKGGLVTPQNYMQQASTRIQEYQQARDTAQADRLTANEQIAIVDAYRDRAGLQPEGYYRTAEGAAVPRDRFAEIRRKRTEDDAWENFKANISHTTLQNLNAIRSAQAKITDGLGITDGALAQATQEGDEVTRILQPLGGKSGFAGQAVGNVMNLFLSAGQAPAMFAVSTAGHTFIDVAKRRQAGQEISPYAEWTAAITNATIEYALESFGQGVARKAGAHLSQYLGTVQGAVSKGGIRSGIHQAATLFSKFALRQTGLAAEGAAEEGITQLLQNTTDRLSFAADRDISEGVWDAALQGAVMPLLASGPMSVIQHGQSGRPTPIAPDPGAGVQTLTADQPLAHLAGVEQALESEGYLRDELKASYPAEADLPTIGESEADFPALQDKWIGDRQLAEYKAEVSERQHRRDLSGFLREGEQIEHVNNAIQVYMHMKENPDVYTVEAIQDRTPEQQRLIDRAQNLSPGQQAFAERMLAENRAMGLEAMDAGVLQNFRENYSALIWKHGDQSGKRKAMFTVSTARARQRTLGSLMEGWQKGLTLEVPGAIEAQKIARQQIAQVIQDRNFVELGLAANIFSIKKTGENTHKVQHPNFVKWVPAGKAVEGQVFGPDLFVTPDGALFRRAKMYASKPVATRLNKVLGSTDVYAIKGVGEILKYNQALKHVILTTSGFHYAAFIRSYMLGSRGINPAKAYREGRELVEKGAPIIDEGVRAGLTLGQTLDFDPAIQREGTKLGEIIDKVPMASDVRKALRTLSRKNVSFLFGKFGPYLKAQAFALEFQYQLKQQGAALAAGTITRHEIAGRAANLMNDDFGGLNLQRMGRSPTLQAIHRAVSLAPDWTESNVRSMVKAFKIGDEANVYRAMWGRIAMKGIGATILFNILMSSLDDEDTFLERYKKAWDSGNLRWLDADITPLYRALGGKSASRKYFSLIGHFRDPVKFLLYPGRSARNKTSVLGRMTLEALAGKNWRGQTFTSFGELLKSGHTVESKAFGGGGITPAQIPSFLLKQIDQTAPIQVQSLAQLLRGEIEGLEALSRMIGLPTTAVKPRKPKRRAKRKRVKR